MIKGHKAEDAGEIRRLVHASTCGLTPFSRRLPIIRLVHAFTDALSRNLAKHLPWRHEG